MIRATGDDRAILWMFRASKLLCRVSFKLRFNYFMYLIYQLFMGTVSEVHPRVGLIRVRVRVWVRVSG